MSEELIIAIVGGIATVIVAVIGIPRLQRSDLRADIAREVELYKSLPDNSASREALLNHIDSRVRVLTTETQGKRHGPTIVLGVLFTIIGIAGLWPVIVFGAWWWATLPISLFIILLGGVGLAQGIRKEPRDSRGRILSSE